MKTLHGHLLRKIIFVLILFVGALLPNMATFANQADIGPNFVPGTPIGFWGHVTTITKQSNGKILVGGNFSAYKGATANKLIRLHSDGSRDASLSVLTIGDDDSDVFAIAEQSNGRIIVGGDFESYDGSTVNNIVRLTASGSRDTSFDMGDGFDGTVYAIAVQNNGKILVGGNFTSYNGDTANNIVRLNSDGTKDTSFDMGDGFDGIVRTITIQNNGKILIGGGFSSYDGTGTAGIVRLNTDGTQDVDFTIGDGFNNIIYSIALENGGKIVVGGTFNSYNGDSACGVVRLDTDGTKDPDFDTSSCVIESPRSIAIQNDGGIIIVGTAIRTTDTLVRLNSDGSKDTSFDIGQGLVGDAYAVAVLNTNKILVGGNISSYKGSTIQYMTCIDSIGDNNPSFDMGNGLDGDVYSIVAQSDGKVIAGGTFGVYNHSGANNIVRMNADGSRDASFTLGEGFDGSVLALGILSSDKIIVAGDFSTYDGGTANKIARINSNGTYDGDFSVGDGFNGTVNALVVYTVDDEEKILVGGNFTSFDGTSRRGIARITSDGGLDGGFLPDISGFSGSQWSVNALAIQNDGKIIVGGNFTSFSGTAAYRIIRLNSDGTRDASFVVGNGFNDRVNSISIQSDGKIIVGGAFTTYSGSTANKIIRLNTNGSIDTSFVAGNGFDLNVFSTLIQSGNKILVGGSFSQYKGVDAYNIIRLNSDGSRDTDFVGEITVGNKVAVLSPGLSGAVLAGGHFMSYKGIPAGYLVSLYGDSDVVLLPNSTTLSVVKQEFTDKGYVQSNGDLVGSTPISLALTDGRIPVDLSLKYHNIKVAMSQDVLIKNTANDTNYDGIISMPISKTDSSLFDEEVLSSFKIGSTTESLSLVGGNATITVPVPEESVGDSVHVYYSENNGASYYLQGTYTVQNDAHGTPSITFTTDHFTDFALTETTVSDDTTDEVVRTSGGGGSSTAKDSCPNGDFSSSYYDNNCGSANTGSTTSSGTQTNGQTNQLLNAYQRAYKLHITTAASLDDANMEGTLLRSHMAKMMVNFAMNVLGLKPDTSKACIFDDVKNQNAELQRYITLSCQLGFMGVNMKNFDPEGIITRAQFGTILSRVLRGDKYNSGTLYYTDHLAALKEAGIMTNILNPERTKELRGWVMLMMMRADK